MVHEHPPEQMKHPFGHMMGRHPVDCLSRRQGHGRITRLIESIYRHQGISQGQAQVPIVTLGAEADSVVIFMPDPKFRHVNIGIATADDRASMTKGTIYGKSKSKWMDERECLGEIGIQGIAVERADEMKSFKGSRSLQFRS